jgi:hypothetical protein
VQQKRADERRTQWLSEKNIAVVRYWNNDVFSNLQGVLSDLTARLEKRTQERKQEMTPSPTLPLSGGGSSSQPWSGA